jgi:5-methylcytosine-specific restriction endonuclease McrA
MARTEFDKPTRRAALKRAAKHCEATGTLYGLDAGQRCNASLAYGVEYDHVIADAHGGEATLDNCAAVCVKCHKFKTDKHDTPLAAKLLRISDKRNNIRKRSTFAGSRNSKWKKKMNGEIVLR